MCPNRYVFVSKSIQFWLRIILGFFLRPTKQPRFGNDFLLQGTYFGRIFVLRVCVFDAFSCPKRIAGIPLTNQPAGQPALASL